MRNFIGIASRIGIRLREMVSLIWDNKDDFMQKYQISKVALFGSYSGDENRDDSDVDIAIETSLSDYFKLYDFKEELENSFHTKVNVVRLRDKMNMALRRRIEKDGVYI